MASAHICCEPRACVCTYWMCGWACLQQFVESGKRDGETVPASLVAPVHMNEILN